MTGTGPFRSVSHLPRGGSTPAEHLGDRLAAFVDGELRDDQRERVQAHLVTCPQCKAEADEQRRLKSAVAGTPPPALSAGLLARLQQLPGGDPPSPGGGGGFGADFFEPRGGLGGPDGEADSYLAPSGRRRAPAPAGEPMDGFPIHPVGRAASRSRRFAFAAAGAFSLAALALGGALPLDAVVEGGGGGDPGTGNAATPLSVTRRTGEQRPGVLTAPLGGATPLSVTHPLLSRGAQLPSPAGGLSPAPLDQVRAADARTTGTTASTSPEAVPVTPSPLPLLGGASPSGSAAAAR